MTCFGLNVVGDSFRSSFRSGKILDLVRWAAAAVEEGIWPQINTDERG
jgi:hypothetical protein